MKKRIQNVYDYDSYRILLIDDFTKRHQGNRRFSLRSYATNLGISVGFLSKIMHHKKHLHPKKGRLLFAEMGFSGEELDYLEDLVLLNTAADHQIKQELRLKIGLRYPQKVNLKAQSGHSPMVESVFNFVTYALLRKLKTRAELFGITDQLNIPRAEIEKSLLLLKKEKYLRKSKDRFQLTAKDFQTIRDHDHFCLFAKELADFFYRHYVQQNITRVPDNTASTLVLGFDEDSIREVHELNRNYILGLLKLSERTKKTTRSCFVSHLYLEKPILS